MAELLELCTEQNIDGTYLANDVKGMTITKEIIPTKADVKKTDLKKFWVIHPNDFIYNPRTHGKKIGFGFNDSNESFIISWNNTGFHMRKDKKDIVLPEYLFMHFNRPEWDREACYRSWGTSTEVFSWDSLCDMKITLPAIDAQRKAVAIYRGLKDNLATQEVGLADLKLTCDGFLDRIKHTAPKKKVRELLEEVDERNDDESLTDVQGINIAKQFMPTIARIDESSLHNYKIVRPGEFAFSGMQTGRDQCIRIARQTEEEPIIVSSAYTVLRVRNKDFVAAYLMMWFSRAEIDRYGWFASDGSIRSNLDLERFFDMEVPVPSREIQQSVVHVFHCYIERQRIADALRQQLKDICPILVRGALKF